jgi:hypothetical protein
MKTDLKSTSIPQSNQTRIDSKPTTFRIQTGVRAGRPGDAMRANIREFHANRTGM